MNHLILTEQGFKAPNWKLGLENASIIPFSGGEPPHLPRSDTPYMVWVLSSTPDWEALTRSFSPQCPVIVLSKVPTLPEMQEALSAGARGYMEALAHPVQLQQAASSVSQGALWIAPPMLSRLMGILSSAMPEAQEPPDWQQKLTAREREVAEIVITGATNREVAERLHITVRTVKEHLTSVFSKLGIQDRLHLILLARGTDQSPEN